MPALSEAQLLELTRRNHARMLGIRQSTVSALARLWAQLQPIGDTEAERFATTAAKVVTAAQVAVSSSTAGYLRLATGLTGPSKPLAGELLRGVPPFEVYMRGIITVRRALSDGKVPVEALRIGEARTLGTAATDVVLAQRGQIDEWVKADKVQGYRRVLTGLSCLFCATASTQRYGGPNLMPLHAHCDCGVAPIIGDKDPGQVINRPLLKSLKAQGKDYWKKSGMVDADGNFIEHPAVHTHGELGPTLARPGDSFTGPRDLAAA